MLAQLLMRSQDLISMSADIKGVLELLILCLLYAPSLLSIKKLFQFQITNIID